MNGTIAWLRRLSDNQHLRFLLVGGYNTAFGYLFFTIGYLLFGDQIHYIAIGAFGHFIAVTNSFLTQRYIVFRSRGPWLPQYWRFQLAYLGTLPLGVGLLALFHELVGLPILAAQACAMVILIAFTYLASSRFVFRPETFVKKGGTEKHEAHDA